MNEKIEKFLIELEKLMNKYEIYIEDASCGCCGYTSLKDKDGHKLMSVNDSFSDNKLADLLR